MGTYHRKKRLLPDNSLHFWPFAPVFRLFWALVLALFGVWYAKRRV